MKIRILDAMASIAAPTLAIPSAVGLAFADWSMVRVWEWDIVTLAAYEVVSMAIAFVIYQWLEEGDD